MGSGSHCPHWLFVRITQNLVTSWSAFRLAPDPIKSILYTETRMISPKIYKFNQVTDTLEMPWMMFDILEQSTCILLWKTEGIICPLRTLDCLQLLSTDTSLLHSACAPHHTWLFVYAGISPIHTGSQNTGLSAQKALTYIIGLWVSDCMIWVKLLDVSYLQDSPIPM